LGRDPIVWMLASFMEMFFLPFINGSNQAIWQSKVPPEMQGRVFAVRSQIAQISAPVAMAITGPLTDRVLTPSMDVGGSLAPVFGWLVGIGPGAGISLLFVIMGVAGFLTGLAGYLLPHIRNVEEIIPDHDQVVAEA